MLLFLLGLWVGVSAGLMLGAAWAAWRLDQAREHHHVIHLDGSIDGGPMLTPITALVAVERALQAGEDEHGDRWKTRSVAHHVGKSMGHARRALGRTPIDADSGQPHLALAAARLMLAYAVWEARRGA